MAGIGWDDQRGQRHGVNWNFWIPLNPRYTVHITNLAVLVDYNTVPAVHEVRSVIDDRLTSNSTDDVHRVCEHFRRIRGVLCINHRIEATSLGRFLGHHDFVGGHILHDGGFGKHWAVYLGVLLHHVLEVIVNQRFITVFRDIHANKEEPITRRLTEVEHVSQLITLLSRLERRDAADVGYIVFIRRIVLQRFITVGSEYVTHGMQEILIHNQQLTRRDRKAVLCLQTGIAVELNAIAIDQVEILANVLVRVGGRCVQVL